MLPIVSTVLCLTGTVLNVKKLIICFHFWVLGNLLWLIYDLSIELYSRALLDIVQLTLAVWGYIEWRNLCRK